MDAEMEKLRGEIKRFLEVYEILSPPARVQFEAQLLGQAATMDERAKKLQFALLESARGKKNIEETLAKMDEAAQKATGQRFNGLKVDFPK